jgi:uroporphyrinogen-III synthase
MTGAKAPRVAVFRPDDGRLDRADSLLEELGVEAVADPMLAIEPTDATPRTDADYTIFTSTTGVERAASQGWEPTDTDLVAIGPTTASAVREAGFGEPSVPEEYTSAGLVATLDDEVDGARIEVARSDHGSDVLLAGLEAAGAFLHETVLYELGVPEGAGESVKLAAEGALDAVLFSSSLTVEHFFELAAVAGNEEAVREGLDAAVVGAIGPPTAETAREAGIAVDVVPAEADFEALARAVVADLDR